MREVVLDIGCGDSKAPGALGVDLFALPGVDLLADLDRGLPLRDSCADALHASHVLEHVNDLVAAMNELWRVCKPGARLYITIPHASSSYMTWRDPTHRRGINLVTLSYFDRSSTDGRRFAYYCRCDFRLRESRLRFASAGGLKPRRAGLKRIAGVVNEALEWLANRGPYSQQLCERWWGAWFGVAEGYAVLEAVKPAWRTEAQRAAD